MYELSFIDYTNYHTITKTFETENRFDALHKALDTIGAEYMMLFAPNKEEFRHQLTWKYDRTDVLVQLDDNDEITAKALLVKLY